MNRIEKKLEILKQENKKALITYITAGLPDLETTKKLIFEQETAGADILEIGIPFSDPVADGPVVQNASYKAIKNGAVLTEIFDAIKNVRKEKCELPIVFMMYYNTVYHYGLEAFVKRCVECGVDGLIIPDLPFEEQKQLKNILDREENSPVIIQLVFPASKQRVPMILENARGFVYCVLPETDKKQMNSYKDIGEYLDYVKKISKLPVMAGGDIKTAEDIKDFKAYLDGVIVSSHLIEILEDNGYLTEAVSTYVSEFKKELNQD